MFNKVEGVLMQLNDNERDGLEEILRLAELHMDEARYPISTTFAVTAMVDGLREIFNIAEPEEQPEARLTAVARRALKRGTVLDCANVGCLREMPPSGRESAWKRAREAGWKLAHPESKDMLILFCSECSKDRGLTR